ncbi:hypothetical protein HMI54_014547 [Coelomomyces lativittatus]|nr:hypothetical protein HMI55_006660 [Coelomomyces lativittatus]KAJ1512930.1 hypothetical protein HMI56_003314 [Coelomomyces lativittatus]KAJ1518592.1 hypothetical protein HMI54_014547 [Coelomomyces lativittatus]
MSFLFSLCKPNSNASSSSSLPPRPRGTLCNTINIAIFGLAGIFLTLLGIFIQARSPTVMYGQHAIENPEEAAKLCFTIAVFHLSIMTFNAYRIYGAHKLSSANPRPF